MIIFVLNGSDANLFVRYRPTIASSHAVLSNFFSQSFGCNNARRHVLAINGNKVN